MQGARYSPYKRNTFMTAVRKGRIDRVREIITSRGPCYLEEWKDGYSLLRTALEKKHTEIAKLLLASGSKVNCTHKSPCNTPLHHAIVNRDVQFVQMLLDKGANINAKNTYGRTPLHNAVQIMGTEIIGMLLNKGADLNAADKNNVTPMHLAVMNDSEAITNLLLSRGANVNGKGNDVATSRHVVMDKGYIYNLFNIFRITELALILGVTPIFRDGSTPLHLAVGKGNEAITELLLNRGANVDAKKYNGTTALYIATTQGYSEIVRHLLKFGADVNFVYNSTFRESYTALHCAIERGSLAINEMLLSKGANVNAKDKDGKTCLHIASEKGYLRTVEHLLEHGAEINSTYTSTTWCGYTPLHFAVKRGEKEVVELLLNRGADVNATAVDGTTSLHLATQQGYSKIVDLLLIHGACVDSAYTNSSLLGGYTPLHVAVEKGGKEIFELLLSSGADVNAKGRNGVTCLHIALAKGHLQIAEHLLRHGASVNSACTSIYQEGYTPLHLAAEKGAEGIIKLILSKGADVNAVGEFGATSLHLATQCGNLNIVEQLLKHGACANSAYTSTFREGYTPLHLAVRNGNEGISELLLTNGADVNAEGINGVTSLCIATEEGYLIIVQRLLKYGARVNSTSQNGPTPLHLAVENGHETIVSLLLEYGADVNSKFKNGKTALHTAVERGCSMTVEHILKHRPDLNEKSNSNVLNVAVQGYGTGFSKIVTDLLKYGFTVNPEDANNFMYAAVEKGYVELVEKLLKHGADVNTLYKSAFGFGKDSIPLHVATRNGQEEVAKLLISYGADVNASDVTGNTSIFYATENADVKITKLLLANKANIKNKLKLLNIAVQKDCREIVEIFLQLGADVNATDKYGRTPLHFVVAEKEQKRFESPRNDPNAMGEVAKLLLSRGANANVKVENYMTFHWGASSNPSGVTTMLHAAIDKGYVKVVEALLEYKADVHAAHEDGMTPLHLAAQRGNEAITKMLLNKGANINAERRGGMTALFCATERGHKGVVELLVKRGAKMDDRTKHSLMTPLHIAVECGHPKIVELFLRLGADIDSRNKFGMTSLHIACRRGHEEIVAVLLEHGCDVAIKSRNNCTAFGFAMKHYGYDDYDNNDLNYYEDDRDTSPHLNIADILKRHVVKMRAANLYAGDDVSLLFPSDSLRSFYEGIAYLEDEFEDEMGNVCNNRVRKERKLPINEFQDECEKEIERMKSEKVVNANITFYDILSKNVSRLAMYARNRSVVEAFKSGDCEKKFPIYGSMMINNFRKGKRKKEFLERGNKILDLLFNDFPVLPRDCTEGILSYLKDDDLRALADIGMPSVHC